MEGGENTLVPAFQLFRPLLYPWGSLLLQVFHTCHWSLILLARYLPGLTS